MGTALSIIAIVVLLSLVVVSLIKQHGRTAETRMANENRTAGEGDQRERSLRRRAEARAARDADL